MAIERSYPKMKAKKWHKPKFDEAPEAKVRVLDAISETSADRDCSS
jgi:hypothetical protein